MTVITETSKPSAGSSYFNLRADSGSGKAQGIDGTDRKALGSDEKERRSFRVLKAIVSTSIILLFLQLLLGMWDNLFAAFPVPAGSMNPIDQIFTEGPPLLAAHVVVGLVLGVLSIIGLIGAAFLKKRRLIALEASALISVLIAGESGIEFVLSGYQEDVYSYTMTVGYALLLATYIWTSRKMGN